MRSRLLILFILLANYLYAVDLQCLQGVWEEVDMTPDESMSSANELYLIVKNRQMLYVWVEQGNVTHVQLEYMCFIPDEQQNKNVRYKDIKNNESGDVYLAKHPLNDTAMINSECYQEMMSCSEEDLYVSSAMYGRGNLNFALKESIFYNDPDFGYFVDCARIKVDKAYIYDSTMHKTNEFLTKKKECFVIESNGKYVKMECRGKSGKVIVGYLRKKDIVFDEFIE